MKTLFIIIVFIGIISCKKEIIPNEPPYIEQWWDEYYGTYTVFDTANDVTYQMEIKQIERYFEGITIRDSVYIENINNQFNGVNYFQQDITYIGGINFISESPSFDSNGYRWSLSSGIRIKENNDTLELKYTKSNIQYYLDDNVPFYNCICIDLAVKNE